MHWSRPRQRFSDGLGAFRFLEAHYLCSAVFIANVSICIFLAELIRFEMAVENPNGWKKLLDMQNLPMKKGKKTRMAMTVNFQA